MEFEVVVGSWGAYTNNTERALGSDWIDFAKYDSWEEIEEELKRQGFDLEGEDEELFIQDTDFEFGDFSGDYTHPKTLYNLLSQSGSLKNEYKYKEALAFMEARSFDDLKELVDEKGEDWDGNFIFYLDGDKTDVAYEQIKESVDAQTFKWLEHYIDFEKYADEMDNLEETKYGCIEFLE